MGALDHTCSQRRSSGIHEKIKKAFSGCSTLGVFFAIYFFSTAFDFLAIAAGVSVSRLVALLLIAVCFANVRKLCFEISGIGWVLFGLMALGVFDLIMTPMPHTAINSMFSFELSVLIAFLALSLPFSDTDIRLCLSSLIWASFILCVLMFVSPGSVGTEWVSERVVVSIAGSQQDANEFCGYMIFAVSLLTYYAIKRWKLWNFLFVGIIFYCIMMTGSRGGLIANLAAFFAAFSVALKQTNRKMIWLVISGLLIVLVLTNIDTVLAMLPGSVAERFLGASISKGTGLERTTAWKNVLAAFGSSDLLRQFLGHGYNATIDVTFNGLVAHNSYIEVLYSFGFVGLLLYMFAVVLSAVRAWCSRRFVVVFALVGFCALLMSLSSYAFKPFWAVVALALMGTKDWNKVEPTKARI
ncbi:MAG: O-antigen ligase family protein [Collinsella sp.]|nr:O-antigen ligase family protein [Collinsella sp.]